MKRLLVVFVAALAGCTPRAEPAAAPDKPATSASSQPAITAPAGNYILDPAHTSVVLRVSHLGVSMYTARFKEVAGSLVFDPARPAAQSIKATLAAGSLDTDFPYPDKLDFDTQVETEFLNAKAHPQITFASTKVEPTEGRRARVTGDLTLNGVTRPVVLDVSYNGGYPPNDMDPQGARIGFSARGKFKRSEFGITYGLPAPGTTMGVGDEVEVMIETEFTTKASPFERPGD